jgi:hypothetical protein
MPPLAVVPELESEIDRLFSLPLADFTEARNDLVRRLKAAGQRDDAAAVQALRKPTVPVWTINQLARQQPDDVEAFLDAAAALRKAQEDALAGGESEDLRSATSAERQALRGLTDGAQTLLEREGTASTLERVASTLRAAALHPETRDSLSKGRLTEELRASGFGAFEGMTLPKRRPARGRKAKTAAAPPSAAERRRQERLLKLRERTAKLRKEAEEAEREAKHAQAAADRARSRSERAASAAEKAEAELQAAEGA